METWPSFPSPSAVGENAEPLLEIVLQNLQSAGTEDRNLFRSGEWNVFHRSRRRLQHGMATWPL